VESRKHNVVSPNSIHPTLEENFNILNLKEEELLKDPLTDQSADELLLLRKEMKALMDFNTALQAYGEINDIQAKENPNKAERIVLNNPRQIRNKISDFKIINGKEQK